MNAKLLIHKNKQDPDRLVTSHIRKKIWLDVERIFSFPEWPKWFTGLDVIIMVKTGVS